VDAFPAGNGPRASRSVALLERIERCHLNSAERLRQVGRDEEAARADRFAAHVRADLEDPRKARRFYDVARALRGPTDSRSFVVRALDGALRLAGADRGNLQLRNPLTRSLRIAAQTGFEREFLDYFSAVDDNGSACGRAMAECRQVVIGDVNVDPRFAIHRDIAAASAFRAVQSTPLVDRRGRIVGVVSTHYETPYRPSQQDLLIMRRYAELVGSLLADGAPRSR
jgi:GAF domain-containing protein